MRVLSRRTAVAAVAALGVAGSAVLAVGLTDGRDPAAATGAPAPGTAAPAVPAAEPAQPTLPAEGETLPVPASDVHVRIPAVGLDLPLLPLTPRDGAINPPLLTAGYWLDPYGRPVGDAGAADNTLYLAAHATGTGGYGFDPLLDAEVQGSVLEPGDVVEVSTPDGTVQYTVQRSARYDKDDLPGATDVWEDAPGRLVLITCLQRAGAATASENLVVFAQS